MGFFSRIWGKKISQNAQNWENKDHFWIGNDSLIRWKNGQIKALNMMLVTRPRLLQYPYIVTKYKIFFPGTSRSVLTKLVHLSIFFRRGGGGGGGGGAEGFPAGIRQLELLEKKHLRLSPIIICLNDNPWLTYFMARSFCNLGLDSLEIIASCDWEVGLSLLKMTSEISVKCH